MDSLPNEILLNIFENLEYCDLKLTLPRVCKHFSLVIAKRSAPLGVIDKILFRDGVDTRFTRKDEDYKPHFILDNIRWNVHDPVNEATVSWNDAPASPAHAGTIQGTINPSLLSENASSPAVSKILLRIPRFVHRTPIVITRNGEAVTVRDMLDVIHDWFETEMSVRQEKILRSEREAKQAGLEDDSPRIRRIQRAKFYYQRKFGTALYARGVVKLKISEGEHGAIEVLFKCC